MKSKLEFVYPCSESWSKMKNTDKGKLCELCSKTIYNVTEKTDAQIAQLFKEEKTDSLCLKIQKKRTFPSISNLELSMTRKAASFILATTLTSFMWAQNNQNDTINEVPEILGIFVIAPQYDDDNYNKPIYKKVDYKKLNGWINDENNNKLANAEVNLITKRTVYKIRTNKMGYFGYNMPDYNFSDRNILVIRSKEDPSKIFVQQISNYENTKIIIKKEELIALNPKLIARKENYFVDGEKVTQSEFEDAISDNDVEYIYLPKNSANYLLDSYNEKGAYLAYTKHSKE